MKNKQGFAPTVIIIILAVLALGGYFVYKNQVIPDMPNLSDRQTGVNTTDWKTYRNEKYGFEFEYPRDFTSVKDLTSAHCNGGITIFNRADKNGTFSICLGKEYFAGNFKNDKFISIDSHNVVIRDDRDHSTPAGIPRGVIGRSAIIIDEVNNKTIELAYDYLPESQEIELKNLFNQILSTFRFTRSSQPQSSLTIEKILNSNGYTNGTKEAEGTSRINRNDLIFGDVDGDGLEEAVTTITSCGASCGVSVVVFKFEQGKILMGFLPKTNVSGSIAKINSIKISDRKIYVSMTDFSGTRTNTYEVEFTGGKLKILDSDPPLDEGNLP